MQPIVHTPGQAPTAPAHAPAKYPFYLHPDTARALLSHSRQRIARARAARHLRQALHKMGWGGDAAHELAEIHLDLQGVAA